MRKIIFSVVTAALILAGSATAFADGPNYQQPSGMGNTGGGTSSGQSTSSMPSSTQTYRASVTIKNMRFTPTDLTVWQGTTVTWTNQDNTNHTVTSDNTTGNVRFDSGTLAPGQQYSYTFSNTGIYTYHCSIHPNMTGTINVMSRPQQTTTPTTPQPSSSKPPANAQATANATVNNYSCSGYGSSYTAPKTSPAPTTTTPTRYYSTAPSYSTPMAPVYTEEPEPTTSTTVSQPLPSTGPAGTAAIAAATTALGAGGYYIYLLRRKKLS